MISILGLLRDLTFTNSLYVCIPASACPSTYTPVIIIHPLTAIVCVAWVRNVEAEHARHIEHIKAENGGELPPTPEYDYLHKRAKPFPWGMNSLFFNPHVSESGY